MYFEEKTELKKALNEACALFNVIDDKTHIMEKAGAKGQLSDIFKYELLAFLMCLSASDGRISKVEAKLIRDYFDVDLYPGHIKKALKMNGIATSEFYEKVPESLKITVSLDNLLIENNNKVEQGLSEIVLELFRVFGKEMVVADDKVTAGEQICWSKYISMMTQYVVDESLLFKVKPDTIPRPGTPIEVDYDMSLDKIGRLYTLFVGEFK